MGAGGKGESDMANETSEPSRLAVLIDADNARPSVVEGLLAEVARYGVAGVRRAYGDWTTPNLAGWKAVLLDHSIQPVQQFRYTVGKNATDSAMIIDAMDLLHSRRLDGFCIVSSDSDFTGLARRIREDGLLVIGFGERKTPRPFVAACDRFVFTELLGPEAPGRETPGRETAKDLTADTRFVSLIRGGGRGGLRRHGVGAARRRGPQYRQPVARVRRAYLRLREVERLSGGNVAVRDGGTTARQRAIEVPLHPQQRETGAEERPRLRLVAARQALSLTDDDLACRMGRQVRTGTIGPVQPFQYPYWGAALC
jgi:NYN domain